MPKYDWVKRVDAACGGAGWRKDAAWNEGDHPRSEGGQFSGGGGGGGKGRMPQHEIERAGRSLAAYGGEAGKRMHEQRLKSGYYEGPPGYSWVPNRSGSGGGWAKDARKAK